MMPVRARGRQLKPPWVKHSQDEYNRLASRELTPAFLRVVMYAMGNHKANLHCELKRGALAEFLGRDGKKYRHVEDAIAKAVEVGLLDAASQATCLVVPTHLVEGPIGDPRADCATHRMGRGGAVWAKCHPDRRHHAGGFCNTCYQLDRRQKKALQEVMNGTLRKIP